MGRRRQSSGEKPEKKTPTKVRPIPRKHAGKITEPWSIMEKLVSECECFAPLKVAKIKLWWQKDWKADVDGIATGAQVCKASEIDRNISEEAGGETVDLFIKLPETQWTTLDETEKEHRLFHELLHIKPSNDSNGKQKRDAKDRLLWRLRRHPITAFHEEIERYGIDRVVGHAEAIATAMRTAERPMEKIFDAAENARSEATSAASGDSEAWKKDKLFVLKINLTEKAWDALEATHFRTLGELQTAMTRHGDFWAKELGIHGRFKDAIVDAFNTHVLVSTQEAEEAAEKAQREATSAA